MRYSSTELKMGSMKQQTSKTIQEKAVTLRANKIRKSIDYTKLENPLYVGKRHELSQITVDHCNEPIKDDVLIKHMKNLPNYLQRDEKSENIQGKALNFGVLDWGRLENWKSNEKRVPPRYSMKTSHSASNLTRDNASVKFLKNKKKINSPKKDQHSSNRSSVNSSSAERLPPGVRWPRGKPFKPQISEIPNDLPADKKDQIVETDDDIINHADDDHLIEENERRLSSCFSPCEFDSIKPFSGVPHSCPFPLPHNADVACQNETPVTPLSARSLEENKKFSKSCEQPALKGRHLSSPNRRFSFSLGKMARSFSFKEASSTPQSSQTVKSGPVNSNSSPDLVNRNSRSSPLRRFLDPLLKLKGSYSTEKVQTPKSKLDLIPTTVVVTPVINKNELLHKSQQKSTTNVQALLQLTLKNGIPFFKLVVESSSDILAAAVKKLPSGKDDTSLIYNFYSVHETKKKSGNWIYQNSKEKSFEFGYNIIGQMKIASSYHAEFSGPEKDLYVIRESVLSCRGTDTMLDGEIAAVIVKNPSDLIGGEIGSSRDTVVVLPEGVHSWPNKGLVSPLINRWRSSRECDCGGWDVGCQFRVLSHQNEITKKPSSLTTENSLDLSYQVGNKNKCSFKLVGLEDGLHSVEYDPSMFSLIQAFSVCVAVVSSQKLTHVFQVNCVPGSKEVSQPIDDEKVKSQSLVSKPPASPVGRI